MHDPDREGIGVIGMVLQLHAGGRGRGEHTLTRAVFRDGYLHLDHIGCPPQLYQLVDVNVSRQQLYINHFSSHEIQQIKEGKEWLICNKNVTLVSCGEEGELQFQSEPLTPAILLA